MVKILVLVVAAPALIIIAVRQAVRAERRTAECRKDVRSLYGGGE